MKKLVMMMAALGVMGGVGGAALPVMATSGDVGGLGEGVAGIEGSGERWEEGLLLEANTISPDLRIPNLYPMHNYMEIELVPSETRALKRLVVAYYDYERGVTEAEADAGLATLGEDAAEWAVVFYDEEYRFGEFDHPLLNLSGFEVWIKGEFTENKRDLLYYAAEFGEPELQEDGSTAWQNTVWLRGKYDYRSCVHGPDFKPVLPNYIGIPTCSARDVEDGKYIVTATRGGEVAEGILTWEEEWRQIQLERLQEIVVEMGTWGTEWQEEAVRAMLERLKKLEVTLTASTGVEDLLVVERALTEQLEGWLAGIVGEVEGEAGDGDGVGDEVGGEVEGGVGDEVDDEAGSEVGGEAGGEVDGATGDGVQVGTGSAVETSGQAGAVSGMSSVSSVSGTGGNNGQNRGEEVDGTETDEVGEAEEKRGEQIEDEGRSEAVEVPALGEVEQRSGFPWWVLVVLLVTGSGLAGWLLYGRKRRKQE